MLRSLSLLGLLAATPAAALSVSTSTCNEQSAELRSDDAGTSLTVNGTDVPLNPDRRYGDLLCVGRNGDTLFGLIGLTADDDETYYLLDPQTLAMTEVTADEARALDFFDTEDDWFDE